MRKLIVGFVMVCVALQGVAYLRLGSRHIALERSVWQEFDNALFGTIRMLHLTEQSPEPAWEALWAAHEYALLVRRLTPLAMQILDGRGVAAEAFGGYVSSLAAGIHSACGEARNQAQIELGWLAEIRRRLEAIREALTTELILSANRRQLQDAIDRLLGEEVWTRHTASSSLCGP